MTTPKNDRKTIFGWCMYDWANSAYVTTVIAFVLPNYFARAVVGEGGIPIGKSTISASAFWAYLSSFVSLFVFLTAPILGAISDLSEAKRKFLMVFVYTGSLFATLLFFCKSGDIWKTAIFFMISQICYISGNVFYDAFLPQIVTPDRLDEVSGRGFAFGYVGGGLQFAISLGLIAAHEKLGIDRGMAARIAMSMTGIWWAGFSTFTFLNLKESPSIEPASSWSSYVKLGFGQVLETAKHVREFKQVFLFLMAFMVYSDGIQTVIKMATIYGAETLKLSTATLMLTGLMVQFLGAIGATLFGKLAGLLGTKRAVMISLLLWSGASIGASVIDTAEEYMILGAVIGMILGGSQALSRSLYGSIIPENESAKFYGFYSVFSKFSAIWGTLIFALIEQITGDARKSIGSLVIFFVAGLILLSFVKVEVGRGGASV